MDGGEWNIEELQMNFADIASEYDIIPDKSDDYDTKKWKKWTCQKKHQHASSRATFGNWANHTLICGDSTNATHVQTLWPEEKPTCC